MFTSNGNGGSNPSPSAIMRSAPADGLELRMAGQSD
jgi:hypothetical protein